MVILLHGFLAELQPGRANRDALLPTTPRTFFATSTSWNVSLLSRLLFLSPNQLIFGLI